MFVHKTARIVTLFPPFPQVCEEFKEISYKLRERTNTIEDLTEQREYLKSVPDTVTSHQTRIDQVMSDYDLVDEYYYTLSDEDFNTRYALYSMFHTI